VLCPGSKRLRGSFDLPFRFSAWPAESHLITQGFGANPQIYQAFGLPGHEGLDFRAPTGSKIFAVADGTISEIRMDGNTNWQTKPYGNQIRILHEGEYTTIYAHLQLVSVNVGERVKAGDLIGLADSTGNSSGSHLHLTLKHKGATARGETNYPGDIVNPKPYME
jgi:murein DD-endopeptidase MepM/ murein hydrolase activator NlpD